MRILSYTTNMWRQTGLWFSAVLVLVFLLASAGCPAEEQTARLDIGLVTDFQPFSDFGAAIVTAGNQEFRFIPEVGQEFSDPSATIATFELPLSSAVTASVHLLDANGITLAESEKSFELAGRRLIVFGFQRQCGDTMCGQDEFCSSDVCIPVRLSLIHI